MAISEDDYIIVTTTNDGSKIAQVVNFARTEDEYVIDAVTNDGNRVAIRADIMRNEDDLGVNAVANDGSRIAIYFPTLEGYDCWHCFCGCCSTEEVDNGPEGIPCDETYCDTLYSYNVSQFGEGKSSINAVIKGLGSNYFKFNTDDSGVTYDFVYGDYRLYLWEYVGDNLQTAHCAARVNCDYSLKLNTAGEKISVSDESEGLTGNMLQFEIVTYLPTFFSGSNMWWYLDNKNDVYKRSWFTLTAYFNMNGTIRAKQEGNVPWCPDEPPASGNCLTFEDCAEHLCEPPQDYIPEEPTIPDDFDSWNSTYNWGYMTIFKSGKFQSCFVDVPSGQTDIWNGIPEWELRYEQRTYGLEDVAHSEMPPYFCFPRYNESAYDPIIGFNLSDHKYGIIRPTQYQDPDSGSNKSPIWDYMALSGTNGFYQDGIAKVFNDHGWDGGNSPSHFEHYDGVHADFKDASYKLKTCNGEFNIPLNTITREYIILCFEQGSIFGRSGNFYHYIKESRGLVNGGDIKGLRQGTMYAEVQSDINMFFCGIYYAAQRLNGWEIWKICDCEESPHFSCSYWPTSPTTGQRWDLWGIPYSYIWLQDARNICDGGSGIPINSNITEVRYDWEHENMWNGGPTSDWEWMKCIRLNNSSALDSYFRNSSEGPTGGSLTTC